jgi:predicted enzyme related to lactoylglutathione lyase
MSAARPVVHWQTLVRDPERAAKFYAACFGWTVDDRNALGYRAVGAVAPGIGGGLWPLADGHPMVQLFVAVPDVDIALSTAESHGARIIIPRQVLPDGDEMAVITDPEGITWGLMLARERHA